MLRLDGGGSEPGSWITLSNPDYDSRYFGGCRLGRSPDVCLLAIAIVVCSSGWPRLGGGTKVWDDSKC